MPKPVYAIVGSEPFLQVIELRGILEQFKGEIDRVDLDGERASLADVLDELRSFAMFGSTRVVVVRDADSFISKHRARLEQYLSSPADTGTLILRVRSLPATQRVYKLISNVGQVIKCDPPKPALLGQWINAHANREYGITLEPNATKLLAELVGADLGRLDRELSKLAMVAGGGPVTAGMVDQCVAFQREQEMYALTDTLSSGNVAAAVKKWRELLQTDPAAEFRAVTWLLMWLQRVMRARELAARKLDPYAIARELNLWKPEQVTPLIRVGQRLGEAGTRAALARLVEVDARCKSGLGPAHANIERFLLSLR